MYSSGYSVQTPESGRNPRAKKRKLPEHSEEILCSVCNIWVVGVPQYHSHVKGGKHQRREKEKALDQVVERMPFMAWNEETCTYKCKVCQVELNSSLVAMMHVNGFRHKENMDAYEVKQNDVIPYGKGRKKSSSSESRSNGYSASTSSRYDPPSNEDEEREREILERVARTMMPANMRDAAIAPTVFECDVCDIKTNSESQLQQHMQSAKHKNRIANPTQPVSLAPSHTSGLKQLQCKTCNVWVNSQTQLDQHMASEKHKSNA